MTSKHCLFTSICWRIKSFYRLSTKLKKRYNDYHVNNLNSNYNVKKIIIGNICYSKQNFVPSPSHTQNLVWIKTCPVIIVFTSIAIWKRLVIYYSVCISVYLHICLSLYILALIYLLSYRSGCISFYLFIFMSLFLSICISFCLICISFWLSVYLSIFLTVYKKLPIAAGTGLGRLNFGLKKKKYIYSSLIVYCIEEKKKISMCKNCISFTSTRNIVKCTTNSKNNHQRNNSSNFTLSKWLRGCIFFFFRDECFPLR